MTPVAELLIELFSEEIPARMQARAADDLQRLVTEKLRDALLVPEGQTQCFATPRRLTLVVNGLPAQQPDTRSETKGPRVGSPEKAIEGFLKSNRLTSLDQCEKRATDKGEFWFAVTERKGRPTADVLPDLLAAAFAELPWPKSMRWADYPQRWVRPLHSILCLFAGLVVPVKFAHLAAGNTTLGHRFLGKGAIQPKDFADYRAKLRAAYVLLDAAERREAILKDARLAAANEGLALVEDDGLLHEVAGLVEWPVVLVGAVDKQFMDVPREVLTTSMRNNQKYFTLNNPDGSMAPRFVVVANNLTDDGGKAVIAGNERVLRARLSDAKFFWDQDRKARLDSRVPALKDIVFHAKLGTVADKIARVRKLAQQIAQSVPGADAALCDRAALLAKADLVTGMVGEFPELQGVMGRYYARHDGESPEVADAVAEHYSPLGPNDRCPTAPVSVAVALADKIDTLVGFFAIDEKPTGSKDPFALRRAALGVIRLILENKLRLRLSDLFGSALTDGYKQQRPDQFRALIYAKVPDGLEMTQTLSATYSVLVSHPLLDFFADRLKVHLREQGVRHDLVSAVFAAKRDDDRDDDLVRLLARVEALKAFLDSDDGANLLVAYRRAANIVRIEEKKDKQTYDGMPDPALLKQDEEKALVARLGEVEELAREALAHEEFAVAGQALARLRKPVDAFFDKVTVNADDAALRANRLMVLSRIKSELDTLADFSRIEG